MTTFTDERFDPQLIEFCELIRLWFGSELIEAKVKKAMSAELYEAWQSTAPRKRTDKIKIVDRLKGGAS